MNAERLLEHFERISEAPDAVARLRRFILDLAVRGKLVEQDPEDEPAEELLGRILELKVCSTGKLPKSDLQLIDRLFTDEPFAIPDSWTWVVLGQITDLITSGSRDWAKHYSDSGAIFVRMGNLVKGDYRLRLDSIQHVSPPAGGEGTRTRLETWDVLVSITGDVGMLGLIPEGFGEAYINQHTALARPCSVLKGRYLPEFLRSDFAQSQFQEPQRGVKKPNPSCAPTPVGKTIAIPALTGPTSPISCASRRVTRTPTARPGNASIATVATSHRPSRSSILWR